jgi:hypothetical protein
MLKYGLEIGLVTGVHPEHAYYLSTLVEGKKKRFATL